MFAAEHEKNGVKLHMNRSISEIKGDGKLARSVVLDDGTEIEADLVLIGTGVRPATSFIKSSGIALDA